jgi:purine-cytosine permease-like protein
VFGAWLGYIPLLLVGVWLRGCFCVEAITGTHLFGNTPKVEFCWWDLLLIVTRPQDCKKQQFAAS